MRVGSEESVHRSLLQADFTQLFQFSIDNAGGTIGFDEQERFAFLNPRKRQEIANQLQALIVHEFDR